ncbi:MAG: DUF7544 domain-containing protein [Halobacteriota archaeon]
MALHAIENLDEAVTVTREFLFPLDVRRWLKLAIIAFFVGGGMNLPTAQFNTSGATDRVPASELPTTVPETAVPLLVGIVAVAVLLAIAFGIVGAIMEFVFIESLRTGDVSLGRYWSRRWRQGLRLFGFRVAIGVPLLGAFLGWMALFLGPLVLGVGDPIGSVVTFLLGMVLLFVVGLVYGVVAAFTTVFVVPIMISAESGVLAAWRRLWRSIKTAWKQYLAYAVAALVLTFATGILASIVLGIAALALLVPLGVVAAIAYFTVSLSSTLGLAIVAGLAGLFVLSMVVIWALVQVPILTYLRYYALLVLGDIESSFDLLTDRRNDVRE